MNSTLVQYINNTWSRHALSGSMDDADAQLVLCFAASELLRSESIFRVVRDKFPNAQIALCSTAGEIYHDQVQDNTLVAAALTFEHTQVKTAAVNVKDFQSSFEAAQGLLRKLPTEGLAHMMIFSDGNRVNGSELIRGFKEEAENLSITGGLAGDAANFESTLVGLNEQPSEGTIVAIGFYGQKLRIQHGSQGGWETFGLEKEITRSEGNVLYEIDQTNALELYKRYLGRDEANLPAAALFFPLSVTIPGSDCPLVRTILSIDEENQTMTFAGDLPVGSKVRFMKGNVDKLITAASAAAEDSILQGGQKPHFALAVSCVGRKLVLGPRIEEEVEAIQETLGNEVPLLGFYAYGEISPFTGDVNCQLHNQTMTITSFYELS